MEANSTLDRPCRAAKRGMLVHFFAVLLAFAALFGASTPAHAVDGCKVLLCLAAPSWRSIPECVPTINQLHRVGADPILSHRADRILSRGGSRPS